MLGCSRRPARVVVTLAITFVAMEQLLHAIARLLLVTASSLLLEHYTERAVGVVGLLTGLHHCSFIMLSSISRCRIGLRNRVAMSLNLLTNSGLDLVWLALDVIIIFLGAGPLLHHFSLSIPLTIWLMHPFARLLIELGSLPRLILTVDIQVVHISIDLQVDGRLVDLLLRVLGFFQVMGLLHLLVGRVCLVL